MYLAAAIVLAIFVLLTAVFAIGLFVWAAVRRTEGQGAAGTSWPAPPDEAGPLAQRSYARHAIESARAQGRSPPAQRRASCRESPTRSPFLLDRFDAMDARADHGNA